MIAFLQFLIAWLLSVGSLPGAEALDVGGALVTTAGFAAIVVTVGLAVESIVRTSRDPRERLVWALLAANAGRVGALAGSWVLLTLDGFAHLPGALGVGGWFVVPHLIRLVPFLVLASIARIGLHRASAAAAAAPLSLRRSLELDARMALLPFAPVLFVIVMADGMGRLESAMLPTVTALSMIGATFLLLLPLPSLLRRIWRAHPLPPGPLRSRLEAYAARVGFRAQDILVWPTGGEHLNAAVVGVLPRFRYVFVTDALLKTLSDDEIEAVFAHEAGHARRGHLLLFLGYTSVMVLAAFLPGVIVGPLEDLVAPVPPILRAIALIFVWLGIAFGWLSRRFEQEADVFGIDTLPPPAAAEPGAPPRDHPFASALDRIAAESHGVREITGWRHFSIADRIEFVRSYLGDERVRRRYRRNILLVRGALLAAVAVAVTFTLIRLRFEVGELPPRRMLQELQEGLSAADAPSRAMHLARAADAARAAGRTEDALRWYAEAVRLGAQPEVLRDWATALETAGRPVDARAAWEDLAGRTDASEGLREEARDRAARVAPAPR